MHLVEQTFVLQRSKWKTPAFQHAASQFVVQLTTGVCEQFTETFESLYIFIPTTVLA